MSQLRPRVGACPCSPDHQLGHGWPKLRLAVLGEEASTYDESHLSVAANESFEDRSGDIADGFLYEKPVKIDFFSSGLDNVRDTKRLSGGICLSTHVVVHCTRRK
jgi:hypothetical protein